VLGRPYLALEYVDGTPIDRYAAQLAPASWCCFSRSPRQSRTRMRIVVHRDLKPSNILVTGKGEVRPRLRIAGCC
jgi:serine/threonine protein kinase